MSEPYLGQITMFAGNFAIRGFAICQGQTLPINQNTALFSILGTTYGGDGRTTFRLPDLRGRIAMQQGQGPGLPDYQLGESGGSYQKTLNINEMPSHNHNVRMPSNSEEARSDDPDGMFPAVNNEEAFDPISNTEMAPLNCSNTGGSQSFSIQNPFLAINFLIALTGVFPSRS